MQRRDRGTFQALGVPLTKSVKESRVLLVGAGGIGCELLKNLVTSGFGTGLPSQGALNGTAPEQQQQQQQTSLSPPGRIPGIVVIDLDTIDLSNLNRQFLFRKQHIKKSKALIAKETANQFNPAVNIDAQHASIFDKEYGVEFFEGFDIVFNALDNVAARRHVNKMCLAANVPLIESGTTGYDGQVQAIQKGVTECYDCNEKPVQKSYPICTIRSTPSQSIHCIVWAKSYLLPELFGLSEEESSDVTVTVGDNAEEVAKLKEEAAALKKIRSMMGQSDFAQEVFNKVFHDDIERLRSMSEMWQSRKPPEVLRFETLALDPDAIKQGQKLALQDQSVWGLLDNFKVFCYSVDVLSNRAQAGEISIEFDKDDKDTLDFVTSAANLRAHIFGIPLNSEWDVKQMAGNIIPAIATANALTASLCVLQSFKILRAQQAHTSNGTAAPLKNPNAARSKNDSRLGSARMVFLNSKSTERMILSDSLQPPRPDCPVCSPVYAKVAFPQDQSATLQQLVDLLKKQLQYIDISITVDAGLIYDPDLEDNLSKPLSDFGITADSNAFITVSDDGDEPRVDLVLSVAANPADGTDMQLQPAEFELPPKPKTEPAAEVNGNGSSNVGTEPVIIGSPTAGDKRKREAADDFDESTKKKPKGDTGESPQVVDDDGPILVED